MILSLTALKRPLGRLADTVYASDLAAAPRWSPERTMALQGRCCGVLLDDWAANLRDRFGPRAVTLVREGLGPLGHDLPDAPRAITWFPVATQLRMTELLLDEVAGGDVAALADALQSMLDGHRAVRFLARRLGLALLLSKAGGIHTRSYDVGHVHAQVRGRGDITLAATGAELVTHPTWQLLQLVAYDVLARVTGHPDAEVFGRVGPGQTFDAHVRWG